MGFYMRTVLWALLEFLYMIHVLFGLQETVTVTRVWYECNCGFMRVVMPSWGNDMSVDVGL